MRALAVIGGFGVFFCVFFFPVEGGKLMAPGDALHESIPAFFGPHNLWEPSMLLGYPLFADPSQQFWYPLSWLHALPHAYTVFCIAPFVLAALGMTGFVRCLTKSYASGVAAGLAFALGAFMISHAGHLMIAHPAAWSPFVLWGVESMRRRRDSLPLAGASAALGLCGLGMPQVFAITATLVAAYALVSAPGAAIGRRAFLLRVGAVLALGVAFAAMQLVPEAQLAKESTRATLTLEAFTLYEVPAAQLALRVVFPYIFGPTTVPGYAFSRIDFGVFTEETVGVALVTLALTFIALLAGRQADRRVLFWAAVAVSGLVLAVGDATPLARLTHRLPVYGLFRAPGRNALEWSLAVAVLAGYGTAAVERKRASWTTYGTAIALVAAVIGLAYAQLFWGRPSPLQQLAASYAVEAARIASPLANGALGMPLLTGALALALVGAAVATAGMRSAGWLVVLAVAFDAGTFGWAGYWNGSGVSAAALAPTPEAEFVAARARAAGTRVAWLPGTLGPTVAPNLTTLWRIPSAAGYTPLLPRRVENLLEITPSGGPMLSPDPADRSFDVAGASPVAALPAAVATVTADQPFAQDDLHVFLSPSGESPLVRAAFGLPAPLGATRVALVSELGDSVEIPQGADVADLDIVYIGGRRERHPIVAGRDTAEFAYDRADVRSAVQHRRATVFDGDATTHRYAASFATGSFAPIVAIEIAWRYAGPHGGLTIEKLSLVDAHRHTAAAFGGLATFYASPDHWRPLAVQGGAIVAFENEWALPPAWLARPVPVDAGDARAALRHGVLTDGSTFDPSREAVVEGDVPDSGLPASGDRVRIEAESPTLLTLATSCARACFAIVRDSFDANWRADIDGMPATILPADVALAGIAVPPGTHRVRFRFIPFSVYIGVSLTVLAAAISLALLAWSTRAQLLASAKTSGELRS
jgi:hypothetical protein